jgi:hypothetical protein
VSTFSDILDDAGLVDERVLMVYRKCRSSLDQGVSVPESQKGCDRRGNGRKILFLEGKLASASLGPNSGDFQESIRCAC